MVIAFVDPVVLTCEGRSETDTYDQHRVLMVLVVSYQKSFHRISRFRNENQLEDCYALGLGCKSLKIPEHKNRRKSNLSGYVPGVVCASRPRFQTDYANDDAIPISIRDAKYIQRKCTSLSGIMLLGLLYQ